MKQDLSMETYGLERQVETPGLLGGFAAVVLRSPAVLVTGRVQFAASFVATEDDAAAAAAAAEGNAIATAAAATRSPQEKASPFTAFPRDICSNSLQIGLNQ